MISSQIQAIVCDIGGVLYVGDHALEGTINTIHRLKARYPIKFLTNTTQETPSGVALKLQKMGFDIDADDIITALDLSKAYLREHQASAYLLLTHQAKAFFDDSAHLPQKYVLVGDAQENFNYHTLNEAFRLLKKGYKLIAAAKNRYFKDRDGALSMDAGGFVQALEFAAQTEAVIVGKPSAECYHLVCNLLGSNPEETLMIGDDIISDIKGAQDAGLKAALIKSGKFHPSDLKTQITPDYIFATLDQIDLP